MLLIPTSATVADVSATGQKLVESVGPKVCQLTEAGSIIQAAPHLLEPDQAVTSTSHLSDDCNILDCLVEVNEQLESSEFDDLCVNDGSVQVKGNLKRNIVFWRNIGAPSFILSVINEGYCLSFEQVPTSILLKNNRSALNYKEFVEEAIDELLSSNRVLEVESPPHVVNPLSISVQPNGKKRLILDLRHVNKHLKKQKVKYEDWKTALSYFQKGSYMVSFDLKSGYHHVDIHPDYQSFLGFRWKFSNNNLFRYFVFTVLPFGLSSAPFIFTKVLKPLEKYWRIHGVNIALFLDDGFIIEHDQNTCRSLSIKIKSDLKSSGFVTNDEKSIWEPSQCIQWLGLVWNSVNGTISISNRRVLSIAETIKKFYDKESLVSARELGSFVGKIISAGAVYGNLSRIMTRYCAISIASAQDWDSKFHLDEYCLRELKFWETNSQGSNSRAISDEPCKKSNYVVCSDASGTGCGAHLELNGEQVCHKQWEEHERSKSSTWRELSAIEFALLSFLPLIKGSYVKWFSDSQTACKIIQVGSMKKELHVMAIRIFQLCVDNGIQFEVQWIPRAELERADYISRLIDIDDWQITPSCFKYLESLWGAHTVDCFANFYNRKVERFYSRFWNPGCSGVDFFVQNLHGENCLIVPPVDLIGRAIHYLYACSATATLVVPFWPSSYFWPVISRKFYSYIVGYTLFDGKDALMHGRNTNSLLGSERFYGNVLAVRMKFRQVDS